MKKILILCLTVLCLISASGCGRNTNSQNGVWITYYELDIMLKGDFKREFAKVIENCKELQIGNLYIHTRAFGDSLYKSDYFPLNESVKKYDYDIFAYILDECRKEGLKVHAWINPYRISSSTTNIEEIDHLSPAFKWLTDENVDNDSNVGFASGIYLNPASVQVKNLVLDGIRELIVKYEVDGIHFDDYFYPTKKEDFDKICFQKYKVETVDPLSLADWRRNNVNSLISECYKVIKYADSNIIFSISPTASVTQNYNNLYADVELWIEKGYVDEIIPQLYFGFEYSDESFRFDNLLEEWKAVCERNSEVKLKIGLACYKAKPTLEADIAEWSQNNDIIARQAKICDGDMDVGGYLLFSYSSLFGAENEFTKQRENLKKYLNSGENQ